VEANPNKPWEYNNLSSNPMLKHKYFNKLSYVLK
jgi:hypothetical protein